MHIQLTQHHLLIRSFFLSCFTMPRCHKPSDTCMCLFCTSSCSLCNCTDMHYLNYCSLDSPELVLSLCFSPRLFLLFFAFCIILGWVCFHLLYCPSPQKPWWILIRLVLATKIKVPSRTLGPSQHSGLECWHFISVANLSWTCRHVAKEVSS